MRAYTDGACRGGNPGFCSCAFVILGDHDIVMCSSGVYLGPDRHTNNYAEYQGLLHLLQWAEKEGVKKLEIFSDSELVVKQVKGEYKSKPPLSDFTARAYGLVVRGYHTLTHVKGHDGELGNELADQLCNKILDQKGH
jgi:ribonuclease HI